MSRIGPNPHFKSVAREELTPDELLVLINTFGHLASLAQGPQGLDALILMSTCPDHRHTYNACAYEIEQWLRGGEADFDILLASLEQAGPQIREGLGRRSGNSLFPEAEDPSRVLRHILAGVNPSLERCLTACFTFLAEYEHKYRLFHIEFSNLVSVAREACCKTDQGRIFWELQIEGKRLLDGAQVQDISQRFEYLGLVNTLAQNLTNFTAKDLWDHCVLRELPNTSGRPELPAKDYAERYNTALGARANMCHLWVRSAIPAELYSPGGDLADWWDSFAACIRVCYRELREFFDLHVQRFSLDPYLPFLPVPGARCVTASGMIEETLHDVFILFFDIIRSKRSPAGVKDAFAAMLKRTAPEVYSQAKSTEPSDDAFVAVTRSWERCVETARVCHSVSTALGRTKDGFGGIRMAVQIGTVTLLRTPSGEPITPRDSDVHPVIAYAAYLTDAIKAVITNPEEFTNCIIVSREAKEYLVAQHLAEQPEFVELGVVTGKDGYSTVAYRYNLIMIM